MVGDRRVCRSICGSTSTPPDFQPVSLALPGAMSSTPSTVEITSAVGTLQAALDSGVDLAIHFGGVGGDLRRCQGGGRGGAAGEEGAGSPTG